MDNLLSQNLHIYCCNNTVNFVDPSGHVRCSPLNIDFDVVKEFLIEYGILILDGTQVVLDVAGLVPGFGEPADGINAAIYLEGIKQTLRYQRER